MRFGLRIIVAILIAGAAFWGGYSVRSRSCNISPQTTANLTTPLPSLTLVPPTASPTVEPVASISVSPTPATEIVFTNFNIAGVGNKPTAPTRFTLEKARNIQTIQDYHWNSARGKTPGTIELESATGKTYGPWQAKGSPGQGGVPDAYWTVEVNEEIPAGTYTIIDSDPASWAQNSGTKGAGMSQVVAVK